EEARAFSSTPLHRIEESREEVLEVVRRCGPPCTTQLSHTSISTSCNARLRAEAVLESSGHVQEDGAPFSGSTQRFARHVQDLYLIDGLELRVVIELPDNFLVGCNLEELGLLPDVTATKVIAKDGMAVRQSL